MPRSLSKSKVEDFELKKKNPLGLLDDSNLDSHLKSLKIGDKTSLLQLSDSELKVDGDLSIAGKLTNPELEFDSTYIDFKMNTDGSFGYVRFVPDDLSEVRDPLTMFFGALGGMYTYSDGDIFQYARTNFHWLVHGGGDAVVTASLVAGGKFTLNDGDDTGDKFEIDVGTAGVTTLATTDDDGAGANLTLDPDGDLLFSGCDVKMDTTKKLYLDGGSDTYITEYSDDVVRYVVGGDVVMQISEKGDDGNEINFGQTCVGFTQLEPTYDATTTAVDFRFSNKQFVTFGSGNITNLSMTFPLVSGNFVLLLKQDGTGSRTITNYKVAEFDESTADGSASVKFAGGSNPTLTTDANHVDILSFYWDADNEIAYGVTTLDFQF